MMLRLLPLALAALLLHAVPARSQPHLEGLGQALAIMGLMLLAYLALAITLLVLALRRKWPAFRWLAGGAALLVLGFPLADQGLLKYQQARIAAAEIRGQPADMTRPGLLYVSPDERCLYTLCDALVKLRQGGPLYALAPEDVQSMDFTRPIDLTTADLRVYTRDHDGANGFRLEPLDPATRRPVFDYVLIERNVFYRSRAASIEAALPVMPRGTALGNRLVLETLAAPISPGALDFSALSPDYLSFYIARKAYVPPLFYENTVPGTRLGRDHQRERADWFCASAPSEGARFDCAAGVGP